MDWDELRYVLALARSRTLSAAGASLRVTHTTVSRRLGTLEARLGVRLFDRTPDGFLPTPAGQDLIHVAEQVEDEVLAVESRIQGRDAQLGGALRVSMVDYLFLGVHEAFSTFIERYPGVELTLTASDAQVSLLRREADVVLRLTDRPGENLIGRRLADVRFAPYASQTLVERYGADAPLGAYPWVAWDERLDGRWIHAWLAENAPGARIAVRIDENAILRRQAVCSGMGAFFLPCFEGDGLPGVVRLREPIFMRPLWLLTLPELRHTTRVRAFRDHLTEAFVRLAPVLAG